MNNIKSDIEKKQFKKAYLMFGEEDYLKNVYKKMMVDAVTEGNEMNVAYYDGVKIDLDDVIENAKSAPFFAEKKIIVIENSSLFGSEGEKLAECLGELPESTIILFVQRNVDKRTRLYKAINEHGYVCEMKRQSDNDVAVWAAKILANAKKKIKKADMDYLLANVGTDMEVLSKEIEKLICYCIDRDVVTKEDIDEVCTKQLSVRIFDLMDAVSVKNQKEALDCYYELITDKNEPHSVLRMISRQFNILLQAKDLMGRGMNKFDMMKAMGQQEFVVRKSMAQCKNFSIKNLKDGLEESLKTEEAIKTGMIDPNIGVELLIVKYSNK